MPTAATSTALDAVRTEKLARDDAEIRLLLSVLAWTEDNTTADEDPLHATWSDTFGETDLALAGDGAPKVREFATYELAAALGMSSDAGKAYVGKALELRHRLPRLYARVIAGELAVWKAGRIAEQSVILSADGAAFVDTQLAAVAHKTSWAQVERTVAAALAQFDPEAAEAQRGKDLDARRADVDLGRVSLSGTVEVQATLGFTDAVDLQDALRQGALALAMFGCEEDLDVRRSLALGEMARLQLSFDLTPREATEDAPDLAAPTAPAKTAPQAVPTGRAITLYAHLNATTVALLADRQPVLVETIRSWCASAAKVTIKPVIDLTVNQSTDAYLVPDYLAEQTELRDVTCVFPHCTRRAARCDKDHVIPWPHGHTETDNLANLCRRHHRTKTHSQWTYTPLEPGHYLWRSPSGLTFLRDPHGTTDHTT